MDRHNIETVIKSWIMFKDRDSSLNSRRAMETSHSLEKWKLLLETRRYCIQDSFAQNTAILNRNKGEYDVKCKDNILIWIMFDTDSSLNCSTNSQRNRQRTIEFRQLLEFLRGTKGKYKTVIAQSTAFQNRNKGKYDRSVKIDILNWIVYESNFTREMKEPR